MAGATEDATAWYTHITELSIVPHEYHYILRMVSWFFITLALAPVLPIIILIIYDFVLWLWRLSAYEMVSSRQQQSGTRTATVPSLPLKPSITTLDANAPDDGHVKKA
ncbi:hypothetical protein QBC46DRAFT_382051 [Diplogelasinospora grovesii]|uniref:Uncharacterized protein n=1 Tax=Diplogelasinospora grovesii TaxID=303347 RepID=A0AAN6NB97_9PEZI|nr:hypothetical protein QBC46DRAFT_382051 [Diplogelasinospora grovesii]